ncbi:MAG: hypothetical protein DRJ69_03855 [Thermoprotei archaeon]|nr:MAG: hypothetical protein DRJ69_03855 [Thermoprotei archaeon]
MYPHDESNKLIFLISPDDYPGYTGLARRLNCILYAISRSGINAVLIAPKFFRNSENLGHGGCPFKGIKVERMDIGWLRSSSRVFRLLMYVFLTFFSIKKMCKYRRYVTFIQYEDLYTFPIALLLKMLFRKKIIGDDIASGALKWHGGLGRRCLSFISFALYLFLMKLIFIYSTLVITPSPIIYEWACRNLNIRNIAYVPNCIPEEHVWTGEKPVVKNQIIFVSAFTSSETLLWVKRVLVIAERIYDEGRDFRLVVVGGPLDKVQCFLDHELVKRGIVSFTGYVSDEKLRELYGRSFIGILPIFEKLRPSGQEIKALEYFANGLVVISGPPTTMGFKHLRPGVHYLRADTLEEMIALIKDCLARPDEYSHIATEGRKYVLKRFSRDMIAKRYIQLLRKLHPLSN